MLSPSKRPPLALSRIKDFVGVGRSQRQLGKQVEERKYGDSQGRPVQTSTKQHYIHFQTSCFFSSSLLISIVPSLLDMGKTWFFLSTNFLFFTLVSCTSFSELIFPNFTASYFHFIDNSGAFLFSHNGTFKAAIFNPRGQQNRYYLCVMHAVSSTIIWSANHDGPISSAGKMYLTTEGITVADEDGKPKWSTPALRSSVSGLLLNEMGNLVLLDQFNGSLWQSFDHPTDTIVIGQKLPVGMMLSSAVSDADFSTGDYRLAIVDSDVILQWHGLTYWKLSMDGRAFRNTNYVPEYLEINGTGLFLFGHNGSVVVIQYLLPPHDFQVAQLDASGRFTVSSISGSDRRQEFVGPIRGCQIPFICGKIGLCNYITSNSPQCSCPPGFRPVSQNTSGCAPSGGYSLPLSCNSSHNSSQLNSSDVSYFQLGYGMDYFATHFSEPVKYGVNLSVCQDFCTSDCSCFGIFFENSSGSCYALENNLGSIMSSTSGGDDLFGYIKALVGTSPNTNDISKQGDRFPIIALVLLPFTGFFLILALGLLCWRRRRLAEAKAIKLGRTSSLSSGDLDAFYIPGLPQRFDYEELEVATDNFKTQIGSGGFGSVYKGMMLDKSVVAVKKITNLGLQGKKDFCTEIAVIGNIHHINLVKLRGFCAQGRQRLLVYEYMNRGSLDRTLFGSGPVIEWQERFEIALGTARGLGYLHSGCERKIIHCDVKPENILLQDKCQAKLSDFGLSKLLSPEQSSLFTTMRGTRGYLAPEWLTNSAISEKTDVYSFGMVLLELVSGRKNCSVRSHTHSLDNTNSSGDQSTSSSGSPLVYFPLLALEMHEQGRYVELADPRLEGRVTSQEVEKLVRVALCCAHEEPVLRPSMFTVVGMLEGDMPLGHPRVESLNFLRFYGRRFSEASVLESGLEQSNSILYRQANTCATGTTNDSRACFSYISSQQVSGPR